MVRVPKAGEDDRGGASRAGADSRIRARKRGSDGSVMLDYRRERRPPPTLPEVSELTIVRVGPASTFSIDRVRKSTSVGLTRREATGELRRHSSARSIWRLELPLHAGWACASSRPPTRRTLAASGSRFAAFFLEQAAPFRGSHSAALESPHSDRLREPIDANLGEQKLDQPILELGPAPGCIGSAGRSRSAEPKLGGLWRRRLSSHQHPVPVIRIKVAAASKSAGRALVGVPGPAVIPRSYRAPVGFPRPGTTVFRGGRPAPASIQETQLTEPTGKARRVPGGTAPRIGEGNAAA